MTLFFGGVARAVGLGRARPVVPHQVLIIIFIFIWIRTTLPGLRYDQLMAFGWKVLLPVATINALVTAALVVAL